jgi:DNA mismatch repair ATPase MutS
VTVIIRNITIFDAEFFEKLNRELIKNIPFHRWKFVGIIKKIYNHELILINGNITQLNEKIKAVDNDLEDTLFQDAKQYSKLNPVYKSFISLRDGYNTLQKNILEMSIQKNRLKDIENKLEDFKLKIANYDYQQLKEQVELLKQANEQK